MKRISEKTIERLMLYRRVLQNLLEENRVRVFSHQLSNLTHVTPAQIRRDIMVIGYSGSPVHGYDTEALYKSICEYIDIPNGFGLAIFGLGHLGRAIMGYFSTRQPRIKIRAAFDNDPEKVNRVFNGVRCYPIEKMAEIIQKESILVAILAVPQKIAQNVTDQMVAAGIKGIVNYAPIHLNVPPDVYLENRDMILAVEKAAYFSQQKLTGNKAH